jgi:Rps23 Pro-64 3,4-dihydroxylase Tpa1-like proline 4-hydroxylase
MNVDLCNRVLSLCDSLPWKRYDFESPTGIPFHYSGYGVHPSNPLYSELMAYLLEAAPEFANLNVTISINKYEVGDYMGKHRDRMPTRLRTFLVQLSEPDSYVGGDLIVDDYAIARNQGSIVLFNSQDIWHSVGEVTNGIRYSIVFWGYEKELDNSAD